jgi:uncharacterized Zn-finger protein
MILFSCLFFFPDKQSEDVESHVDNINKDNKMSDEETSNCLKGPSDLSKNTCLNSQDKTKTDFVGTAVKEKKIGSKLLVKIQKKTFPREQNMALDETQISLTDSDTDLQLDDSDVDESSDEENDDIISSGTDDYMVDEDSYSSSSDVKEISSDLNCSNTRGTLHKENLSVSSLDMAKSEIDLFARKAVDKIMGEDLQNRIEKLVRSDIWTCEICGKIFDCKLKHKFHTENHRKKKNHLCQICGRGFLDKKRLMCHMSSHTGDKLFSCKVCGKKLSQMSGMTRHMRIHTGEKPFTCGVCKKSFTTKGSLKVHMRLHTGEKPYKCNICGNSFTARSTLWSHEKIHTGEKDLECKVCGKHFTLNSTLKKHLLIHDETYNERFDCDICGKQYMARNSMQRHRKTHSMTEEKPYTCEICGNKYAMVSSLRRHNEIHFRGELTRDFQCEYCPKSFAYKSSVVLHMKRTHKIKADGTPLDCDSTGMFIVPADSMKEKAIIDIDEGDESDNEECIEENIPSQEEGRSQTSDLKDEIINNKSETFLHALDLVKKFGTYEQRGEHLKEDITPDRLMMTN